MMGWYDDSVGWGGWVAMILMMIAFWGLIIFAVVAIFRGSTSQSSSSGQIETGQQRSPMQTLDDRFALGEIDADEYHARQAVLRDAVR